MSNPLFNTGLTDPQKEQAAQMAVVKLMSTPPEPILELLERLEIPWEKEKNADGEQTLVIKWSDLRAGEQRNQAAGPFIKKVMEQLKVEVSETFSGE